jgi:hypothetical protein
VNQLLAPRMIRIVPNAQASIVIVITHEISSSLLAITSVGSSCNSLSERVALLLVVVVVVMDVRYECRRAPTRQFLSPSTAICVRVGRIYGAVPKPVLADLYEAKSPKSLVAVPRYPPGICNKGYGSG